ncbi:hypothetical protein AYJ57_21790 (plasmid) [Salipiger sp. CCB-MM3]|nr:hypothetical protein AYJ57_21790 [Salipiger sp. CCB-MM3]
MDRTHSFAPGARALAVFTIAMPLGRFKLAGAFQLLRRRCRKKCLLGLRFALCGSVRGRLFSGQALFYEPLPDPGQPAR